MNIRKITTISALVAMVAGCQSLTTVEAALVTQTQKGVDQLRQITRERGEMITQFNHTQRQQLDEAFDADVRQQVDLSADWVINARKAYAIGLVALDRQEAQTQDTTAAANQTADACDEALKKLQWLCELQTDFSFFKPGAKP